MSNCAVGLFVYKFVFVDGLFTSVGAALGLLAGIGVSVAIIFSLIFLYHTIIYCMSEDAKSCLAICRSCSRSRSGKGSGSTEVSSVSLDVSSDWPDLSLPSSWDEIDHHPQPPSSSALTSAHGQAVQEVMIGMNIASTEAAIFKAPCQPLTVAELMSVEADKVLLKGTVSIFQASEILSNDIYLLATLCEGFSLLWWSMQQNGLPDCVRIQEVISEVEDSINEIQTCIKNRETVLLSLSHNGFEKTSEEYFKWETDWLQRSRGLVLVLNNGVTVLDDLWKTASKAEDVCIDLRSPWSQFQLQIVSEIEAGASKWAKNLFPVELTMVEQLYSERRGFEKQVKSTIDSILDAVRVCTRESSLPEGVKERVLTDASTYLGKFKSKCSKSGVKLDTPYTVSLELTTAGNQFQSSTKSCPQPQEILDPFSSQFVASCRGRFNSNARRLLESLEDSIRSQHTRQLALLKELRSLQWLFTAQDQSFLTSLKASVKSVTEKDLAATTDEWQNHVSGSEKTVSVISSEALKEFLEGDSKTTNNSLPVEEGKQTGNTSQTTKGCEAVLSELPSVVDSSIQVMHEAVKSMECNLQLKSMGPVELYAASIHLMKFLVENSLKRLNKSIGWMLRCVLSSKKERIKKGDGGGSETGTGTAVETSGDPIDQAVLKAVSAFACSLESGAVEMIRQGEGRLEKELENLRVAAENSSAMEGKQQKVLLAVKSHLVNQSVSSNGLVHLASERIMHEHQTAIRKIQNDMERAKQHQVKLLQQKLQARKMQHQRVLTEASEQLLSLAPDSAVARALLELLMDVRLKRAEKELREGLEAEQKRETALLEARLNDKMKKKLKSQEIRLIQDMARVHKLSRDQLASEIQLATSDIGMGGLAEQIMTDMMRQYRREGDQEVV